MYMCICVYNLWVYIYIYIYIYIIYILCLCDIYIYMYMYIYNILCIRNSQNIKQNVFLSTFEMIPRCQSSLKCDYIKMKNYTPEITWRIIRKCLPHNYNSRKCDLCLNEKLEIALYKGENLLNKKTELISKCRHQNKFMLLRHDSKD